MDQFPFPLEKCHGDNVLQRWNELRRIGANDGFYPVIIGDSKDAESLSESVEINEVEPSEILKIASSLSAMDVLRSRSEQDPELTEDVEMGDWPASPNRQPIVTHTNLRTGVPKPEIFIAMIPTIHSFEVPAYLRYGAWNDCPAPEEHVAVQRMWQERHGAEIIAITGDVIECIVSRPPATREDAMELARQQFHYCSDIVYQGVETLSNLAAGIQGHNAWYFWWD